MSNNKAPSEYLFDINGNLPPTGTSPGSAPYNKTIYDLEKNVFNSLNDFNKKYAEYINSDKTDKTNINNSNEILNINIRAFDTALNNIIPIDTSISTTDSTRKSNELINNYKNIIDKRNDLDVKMMEINQSIESNYIEHKGQVDSTKYTNILITVIATSLIYYIFVKL